jgi:phosphoesterase RecJ-like protein
VSEITPKSFGEINTADFDLFIVQDSTMDRVTTKVPVVIPSTMKVAIIDHHISNVGGGNFNLIDASYPATGQLLADVFKVWGVTLDHDMAINLITGIFTDTGGFRYAATTPATFATAAELSILAPDYTGMIYKMDNANTAGNIRFQATALSSVKVELGGILAIATVSLDEMQNKQITLDDVNNRGISNALKSVVGWEVGVCATEIELGTTKVSFSTRNPQKFDLSVIAARCGGGGHKASAGAHMKMSLTEARQKIIDAVAASL